MFGIRRALFVPIVHTAISRKRKRIARFSRAILESHLSGSNRRPAVYKTASPVARIALFF
jgi:hypothetical protein